MKKVISVNNELEKLMTLLRPALNFKVRPKEESAGDFSVRVNNGVNLGASFGASILGPLGAFIGPFVGKKIATAERGGVFQQPSIGSAALFAGAGTIATDAFLIVLFSLLLGPVGAAIGCGISVANTLLSMGTAALSVKISNK